ncbi:hypothetical protein EDC01DRAFT_493711 [Geopyxis carbonaria]|nr:hypothetical protein EDC01DRAFT_493711 [Geopyxis carbonaria]
MNHDEPHSPSHNNGWCSSCSSCSDVSFTDADADELDGASAQLLAEARQSREHNSAPRAGYGAEDAAVLEKLYPRVTHKLSKRYPPTAGRVRVPRQGRGTDAGEEGRGKQPRQRFDGNEGLHTDPAIVVLLKEAFSGGIRKTYPATAGRLRLPKDRNTDESGSEIDDRDVDAYRPAAVREPQAPRNGEADASAEERSIYPAKAQNSRKSRYRGAYVPKKRRSASYPKMAGRMRVPRDIETDASSEEDEEGHIVAVHDKGHSGENLGNAGGDMPIAWNGTTFMAAVFAAHTRRGTHVSKEARSARYPKTAGRLRVPRDTETDVSSAEEEEGQVVVHNRSHSGENLENIGGDMPVHWKSTAFIEAVISART